MHGHQRHGQAQEVDGQVRQVLRLEDQAWASSPRPKPEQRRDEAEQQVDGHGADEVQLGRADGHVPDLHQHAEEERGQQRAQPGRGAFEQGQRVRAQQRRGGDGGIGDLVLREDADLFYKQAIA